MFSSKLWSSVAFLELTFQQVRIKKIYAANNSFGPIGGQDILMAVASNSKVFCFFFDEEAEYVLNACLAA